METTMPCYGILYVSVFVFLTTCLHLTTSSFVPIYTCLPNCQCRPLPDGHGAMQVSCDVEPLDEINVVVSAIEADRTISLKLKCNDHNRRVRLSEKIFQHLRYLEELVIIGCNVSYIPQQAFLGLNSLTLLHIESSTSVSLHQKVFASISTLKQLTMINSSVVEFPNDCLCSLGNLQKLNLSSNHFADFAHTGLLCDSGVTLPSLNIIDVSNNNLSLLSIHFSNLVPNLKTLILSNNKVHEISNGTLSNMEMLYSLDLSNNNISNLPNDFLYNCRGITSLIMANNNITWQPGILKDFAQLKIFHISNAIIGDVIWDDLFHNEAMTSLSLIDVGLASINKTVISKMRSLRYLSVARNNIDTLEPLLLKQQRGLQLLDLSENKLTNIGRSQFQGLGYVESINICCNNIAIIHPHAFDILTSLTVVNISFNALTAAPLALQYHTNLEIIDLQGNEIKTLPKGVFDDLPRVRHINLNNNQLRFVPNAFRSCKMLNELNLSGNKINGIDSSIFRTLHFLKVLNLDFNQLSDITSLLHKSKSLRYLYLNNNRLTTIGREMFPKSLIQLSLKSNEISSIQHHTFIDLENLSSVYLQGNNLQTLEMVSFAINRQQFLQKDLPVIFLARNQLLCDCEMTWLHDLRFPDSYQNVDILQINDYNELYCMPTNYFDGEMLSEMRRSEFTCPYKDECGYACACCEYDACDCRQVCPSMCTCFHGDSWMGNNVHCESQKIVDVPYMIPASATALWLSGNAISRLRTHAFLANKNLNILYLNNSDISEIDNGTFAGMGELTTLYLNGNNLTTINLETFKGLFNLTDLYLSDNHISYIPEDVFQYMPKLKKLYLHNNELSFLSDAIFELESLTIISIGGNRWPCDCSFIPYIRNLITSKNSKVSDIHDVFCAEHRNSSNMIYPIMKVNMRRFCPSGTPAEIMLISEPRHVMALASITLCIALSVLLFGILYSYRKEIEVLAFVKFGCRFTKVKDDEPKLYDAFVSYSSEDEHYVLHELAPRLECRNPAYKLCLYHRDYRGGTSVETSLIESVAASHRTIMVLSDNFIDNEWSLYELQSVHRHLLKDKHKNMIVILLNDIHGDKLDPDLKMYLKRKSYLKFGEIWFWQKLFYALPDKKKDPLPPPDQLNGYVYRSSSASQSEDNLYEEINPLS